MDSINPLNGLEIELNTDHENCIISLINSIISKSPNLEQLNSESLVLIRLVSVISLIETTLCSKYQIVLKRNSTPNQSIHLIKSWLKQYYKQEFVDTLCQTFDEQNNDIIIGDKNDVDFDKDIPLISLMILSIAHKLRQSLPRINAYFDPEWNTLSEFDYILHQITNCDKLLDLVQNELCIKRKELEITKSKVIQMQSMINSKLLDVNKEKKTKYDYHSNLFAEYEDNGDNEGKDLIFFEQSEDEISDENESEVYFDPSDDEYVPESKKISKTLAKKPTKRKTEEIPILKKSYRGRGRPPKDSFNSIRITPNPMTTKMSAKGRGKSPKAMFTPHSLDRDSESMGTSEGPFDCEVCGKRFAKEYRLTRHSFTHTGHKQFQCDFINCLESFDLKWKLLQHKQEHNGFVANDDEDVFGDNNHYFQCEWADCGRSFQSKRELTVHEHELHANRSTSKYSCDWPQCKEIFENKIDWRKHVKTHGKIVPTECGFPGCHKSFYKLDSLENHRKIHETFSLTELS